ncbi:hypothetical protein [Haloarchaeobius sp. DFWS5]|uniref:hypothetical protein n=1 Tax=Haloarchaeobius sp. DFWS5 TaxID=3446114 RepID=UPI003EB95BCA
MSYQSRGLREPPATGILLGLLFFFLALGISLVVEVLAFGQVSRGGAVAAGAILGSLFGIVVYWITK